MTFSADSVIESISSLFRSVTTAEKVIELPATSNYDDKSKSSLSPAGVPDASGESEADLAELARIEAANERAKRSRSLRRTRIQEVLPNPGKMDDLTRECQDALSVNTHDGVRFEYHKPVVQSRDKNFTYSHIFWLGPAHLQGGASYEFATQLSFQNAMLMAQLDTNGMLNGRYHQQWTEGLVSKVQFALGPSTKRQFDMAMLESGSDYSCNLKLSHDSLIVGSYIQSITPTISAGIECLVQPEQYSAHSRYVCKYDNKSDILSGSVLDVGTLNLCYARVVSPRLTLASDFKFDPNNRESSAKIGYKWSLRQAQFRGAIDSNGVISAALEESVSPMMRFSVNGEIDHSANTYKFGFGASVG